MSYDLDIHLNRRQPPFLIIEKTKSSTVIISAIPVVAYEHIFPNGISESFFII